MGELLNDAVNRISVIDFEKVGNKFVISVVVVTPF